MKPCAKIGCSMLKPAAVPTYILVGSAPCSARSDFTLAPISEIAWSQEIRSHHPPMRFSGNSRRSGEP